MDVTEFFVRLLVSVVNYFLILVVKGSLPNAEAKKRNKIYAAIVMTQSSCRINKFINMSR